MMTTLWAGLATGALYSLVAIGYNVVLLASGVFNFANAQFVMLSTFTSYLGLRQLDLPFVLALGLSIAIVVTVAVLLEVIAIRPALRMGGDSTLITSIGFGLLIVGSVSHIWGNEPLSVDPVVGSTDTINLLGGTVLPNDLALIAVVIAMGVGMHLWSRYTRQGLASLAAAENRTAARLRGVDTRRLQIAAFATAGAIAAVAGAFVAHRTYAVSTLGDNLALFGFVAIAIGGAGSQLGGLLGGFFVGLIYALSSRYLGSDYPQIAVFFLFLLILMVRPHGLFSRQVERVV